MPVWHLGDVTRVCSRTENLKHLCLVQPSRHALLMSVTPFCIFMSNSSLMGSLVSSVKGTWVSRAGYRETRFVSALHLPRWQNSRCKFGFFRSVITRSSRNGAPVSEYRLKRNLAGHTADHNSLPHDPSVRFDRHVAGQATVLV